MVGAVILPCSHVKRAGLRVGGQLRGPPGVLPSLVEPGNFLEEELGKERERQGILGAPFLGWEEGTSGSCRRGILIYKYKQSCTCETKIEFPSLVATGSTCNPLPALVLTHKFNA